MTTKTLVSEKQNMHHSILEVLCRRAEIANSYFLSRKTWWRTLEKERFIGLTRNFRERIYIFSRLWLNAMSKNNGTPLYLLTVAVSWRGHCEQLFPPLWCFMLFTQLDYRTTITNTWKHKIRHIAESKVVGKIRIAVTDGLAFFRLVCTAIILRILRGA